MSSKYESNNIDCSEQVINQVSRREDEQLVRHEAIRLDELRNNCSECQLIYWFGRGRRIKAICDVSVGVRKIISWREKCLYFWLFLRLCNGSSCWLIA